MRSQTTRLVAIYLGLAGLVAVVFLQTGHFNFVNYDDGGYVFENANIRAGLTWRGVVWAFTHVHSQNWHPLTSISHMIDCQLFGLNAGAIIWSMSVYMRRRRYSCSRFCGNRPMHFGRVRLARPSSPFIRCGLNP